MTADEGTLIIKVRRHDGQWRSLPSYAFHFGGSTRSTGRNATREEARAEADQAIARLRAANRDLEYDVDECDSNGAESDLDR